ncbi:hypothetical protein LTR78_009335 [Recurvomyces mirabilis]|uniref:F-box domain-containing protein n=1 Tax=Recurvomyces mirabilis TaxID=574656 RepID=A0AAE0WIP0_9PEZI|nr:hypothetical protein LTR78_009335 [Recurvomyces mirabilis]
MPTAPYPQYNAGHRLTDTPELLEMILLELPSESILFAQHASKQFRSVIAKSRQLQYQLFLIALPTTLPSKDIILNPIITKEQTLPHVPLYFDEKETAIAYCWRKGRQRIYCTKATIEKDETTGQKWVQLQLRSLFFPRTTWLFDKGRQHPFGAGSWKQMCLSQPPCAVKWRLTMVGKFDEHRYSGRVPSVSTMDAFLEAFAAAAVVDEGEHRLSNNIYS